MNRLKKNITANFMGNIWTGLMSLVFVPLYIKFMGIEAYGLIGIFATLLVLFSLFDMGLGNTLNREMAILSVQENKARDMRDLLRTLEIPYWAMAVIISVTVVVLAPLIAYHWVNAETLSPASVERAIVIMGIGIGFHWPVSLYSSGLQGLQRQALLNGINAAVATCRGGGAVLVLWLVSPTVEAFFTWQIVVSAVHSALVAFFLWDRLPKHMEKPSFRLDLLKGIWRFAAGIGGITILSNLFTQLDKVILSKMLSLEMFGYYSLANIIAVNLNRFIQPISGAIYPQFTNLVSIEAKEELIILYHKGAQLVSVFSLPTAIVIALFSKEILILWTRNPTTADYAHLLMSILVMGTALKGLTEIPQALQIASGWTKLLFFLNFVSVLILVPLTIMLAGLFGAVGAASGWMILTACYVFILMQIMHRRLLQTEKSRWYLGDVAIPFLVSLAVAGTFRLLIPATTDMMFILIYLMIVSAITLIAVGLSTSVTRNWVYGKVSALRF